jgi:hypothetical protein
MTLKPPPSGFVTLAQAAAIQRRHSAAVLYDIRSGRLAARKHDDGRWLIAEGDLRRWLVNDPDSLRVQELIQQYLSQSTATPRRRSLRSLL